MLASQVDHARDANAAPTVASKRSALITTRFTIFVFDPIYPSSRHDPLESVFGGALALITWSTS